MAEILPLKGKYYGTVVQFEHNGEDYEIKVWCDDHFEKPFASEREIARGWRADEEGHDHVESALGYTIARIIERALTEEGY